MNLCQTSPSLKFVSGAPGVNCLDPSLITWTDGELKPRQRLQPSWGCLTLGNVNKNKF